MVRDDRKGLTPEEEVALMPEVRAAEERLHRPNMAPLQKHILYFDTDNDGQVSMRDIYRGCRNMGMNIPLAIFNAVVICLTLHWVTRQHIWDRPWLFDVNHAGWAKHGSDTDIYERTGDFNEGRFDAFCKRWDPNNTGYFTWPTLWRRIKEDRDMLDLFGWSAAFLEWSMLYLIAAEPGKGLSRDTVRKCYDGTLFLELQKRHLTSQRERAHRAEAAKAEMAKSK